MTAKREIEEQSVSPHHRIDSVPLNPREVRKGRQTFIHVPTYTGDCICIVRGIQIYEITWTILLITPKAKRSNGKRISFLREAVAIVLPLLLFLNFLLSLCPFAIFTCRSNSSKHHTNKEYI